MKRTITTLAGTMSLAAALVAGAASATPALAAQPQAPQRAAAAPIADETIIDVTPANYAQVMEMSKTKPVVLDFTATWCHWCQVEKPYLQRYHDADGGTWIWAKVDTDQNRDLTRKYRIDGIPDLLSIKQGQEYGSRFQGFDSSQASALRAWLTNVVKRF